MKDNEDVKQKRQNLYNTLKDEYDIGNSFEEFDSKMNDPERRRNLYETVKDEYDVGPNFEEFENKTAYDSKPAPPQKQIPKKVNESEKSWWDTFLDNFRSSSPNQSNTPVLTDNKNESYFQKALGNMPSGSNPAVGSQALYAKKMGEMDIKDVVKWRMEQYRDNPYVASIAEGFGQGLLGFYDNATGGFNSKFLSEVNSKADDRLKKFLKPDEYKEYKDNFENSKLVRDISSGVASSIGFLTLANGFSATKFGQIFSRGIENSGFIGKILYSGAGSLQALGTGAVIQSIREADSTKGFIKNFFENVIKASMEGMSEEMLPELKGIGKARLTKLITKGISTFFTEGITENVSDMTEDFFNWARGRDLPAVSIAGDLIKNGQIGKDTFYNFLVEGLSGAVMGVGFGAFEREHGEKGKAIDDAVKEYAKDNPEKTREFFNNVIESVKIKSATPEVIKAMGIANEFAQLMGFAGNEFDDSTFDTDERKAIHSEAKAKGDEVAGTELLPELSKIQNPNLFDAFLISGKSKRDGYRLSVQTQLGSNLNQQTNGQLNDIHSFTSQILFNIKQNPEVVKAYNELKTEFNSNAVADDILVASIYPELRDIAKVKLSSIALDETELNKILDKLSKMDNSSMKPLVNQEVIKTSEFLSKIRKPITEPVHEEAEVFKPVSLSQMKGKKKKIDIFDELQKSEDERINDQLMEDVNIPDDQYKAYIDTIPTQQTVLDEEPNITREVSLSEIRRNKEPVKEEVQTDESADINMDFLPEFNPEGKEINPIISQLIGTETPEKINIKDLISSMRSKFSLEENSMSKLLDLIAKRLPDMEVRFITDPQEILNTFSIQGETKLFGLAAYNNGVIYVNARGNANNEYYLRRTILHEALHGLTVDLLTEGNAKFDKVFTEQMNKILQKARENIDLKLLPEDVQKRVRYALTSDKEFVAGLYSATSAHLVPLLDNIKTERIVEGKKTISSIWKDVVNSIKEALGRRLEISDSSLLSEFNRLMDNTFGNLESESVISQKQSLKDQMEGTIVEVTKPFRRPKEKETEQKKEEKKKPVQTVEDHISQGELYQDYKDSVENKTLRYQDSKDDIPEITESNAYSYDVIQMNSVENTARLLSKWSNRSIDGKDYHSFISSFTFEQFMGFYYHVVASDKNDSIRQVLEREYERFHKDNMTFEDFADRRLRNIWNMVKSQSEQLILNVNWSQGSAETGGNKVFYLVRQQGSYKTPDGSTEDTLQAPALISNLMPDIENLLGVKLELNYINGFMRDGTGELRGFHGANAVTVQDCANALYDQVDADGKSVQYIFLNVFGERNTLPILKVVSGKVNLDLIDKILDVHSQAIGSNYQPETTLAEKITSASRVIVEELRLGNTPDRIMDYSKDNAFTVGMNFAKLMKRSYLVSGVQHLEQDETLIKNLKMDDPANRPKGFYIGEKGKIIARSVILDTEDLKDISISTGTKAIIDGKLQEVRVPIIDLLRNLVADKPTTDGASLYVLGQMDNVYRHAFGLLKGGDIKNFISYGSMFIKHAMHGVSAKDPIGRWMMENDLAMITFDSAEKNEPMKKEGEVRYKKTSIEQLLNKNIPDDQILNIPLENFYHIKETGKADSDVKGLMQYVNSSGLTEANPILQKIDPKGRLTSIFNNAVKRMADRLNSELSDFATDEKKIVSMLKRMRTDTMTNQQKRISDILGDLLEGDDSTVLKNIKGLLDNPLLFPFVTSRLHNKVMDTMKYSSAGSMPVIAPDLGYLTDGRIARMRGEILWKLLDEPLDSDLLKDALPNIKVDQTGLSFRDALRGVRDLKTQVQQLKQKLKDDEELSDLEVQKLVEKIGIADKLMNDRYSNMVDAYNSYIDEANLKRAPDKQLKKVDKDKGISFNHFIKTTPKINNWIEDRLGKIIDRNTGRLKDGYAMISLDIARRHGLKAGDKVMISITPTDSMMGGNSFEVAAVLPDDMSAGNKIVLPSEYIQSVGKDYDVDVVSLFAHDKDLYTPEEWNELTGKDGLLPKVYKGYVESIYNTLMDMGVEIPEKIKGLSHEAIVTNEKVHLNFMQKYLGATKQVGSKTVTLTKDRFEMIGQDSFYLGDNFKKEVGAVVSLRTMQTMMTRIGFSAKLGGETIDPAKNFLKNHLMLLIATNDKVDFPKRTNQLQYNSDSSLMESRMLNISKLDPNELYAVSIANRFLFNEIMELPRGKDITFGGTRDLNDTIEYIDTAKHKMEILSEKGSDRSELIKGAKELAKDRISPNSTLDIRLVNKAIEDYIKSVEIKNSQNYPVVAMINRFNTDAINQSKRGMDYDTYRTTEYNIFKDFLAEIKDMFNAKSGRKEDNFFNKGLLLASKEMYGFADKMDRDVIALTLALNSYDFAKGKTFDGKNKNKSLYLLREELVQIARPQQEQASMKAKSSVSDTARSRVFPYLMMKLLDQKAFTYAPGTKRGSSIELEKGDERARVFRDKFDQLKIEYNGNVISAEDVKNWDRLSELFYGRDNFFNDPSKGHQNRSSFGSLVPISSQNVSSEDRVNLLMDWLSSRKDDYTDQELRSVFTSLLVPYRNITKLGRLDVKSTYMNYFANYEDMHMGEKLNDRQMEAYNKIIKHFNQGKNNMQFIKKTLESVGLSLPHLEVPMNRQNLMKPHIAQKRGYQGNDLLLEVTRIFDPEFTDLYLDMFSMHNPKDSVETEKKKIEGLAKDSSNMSMDYLPDFNNSSRAKWFDDVIERVSMRDKSVDDFISQGRLKQLNEFRKVLSKNPQEAFGYLKALSDDIEMQMVLTAFDDYTLTDMIEDIRSGNYERYQRIYDSVPSKPLGNLIKNIDLNDLPSSSGRMLLMYDQMLKAKESLKGKDIGWFKEHILLPLNNIHTFALQHGQKIYNKASKLNLKYCNLNHIMSPVRDMDIQPVLDNQKIYNPNSNGYVGDAEIFAHRSRMWSEQITEVMGELKAYLSSHQDYKNIVADSMKLTSPEARAKLNREIFLFAENKFKQDEKLSKITFESKIGGVKVLYDGKEIGEKELSTELYGTDKDMRNKFLAALQIRKLYDSNIKKVLLNAHSYLGDIYSDMAKENTDIAKQNAKYVLTLQKRYKSILDAIDNWDSEDTSYMPHHYRDDKQFRLMFKVAHWDAVIEKALKERDLEVSRMKKGLKYDAVKANMTDKEVEETISTKMDEFLDNVQIDNPFSSVNPNWKERLVFKNDLYTTTDDSPHLAYLSNLERTLTNDMVFVDSLLYQNRAIAHNENPYVMETMKWWFGNQLNNKLLHTIPISKKDIKPGMEVSFRVQEPVTLVKTSRKEVTFKGKITSQSKRHITVMMSNGTEKTYNFNQDITVSESLEEKAVWGRVSNVSKDALTLNDGQTTQSFNLSKIYSRDIAQRKDELNLERYMVRGATERLDGLARERGWNMDDKKDIVYKLQKTPGILASAIDKYNSIAILGGLGQAVSGLKNYLGGHLESLASNPALYFSYSSRGRKLFRSLENLDTNKLDLSGKSMDLESRELYELKKALVQTGLIPSMVTMDQDILGAMGFGTMDQTLDPEDLNIDPSQWKDLKAYLKLLQDKSGFTEHKAKMDSLLEKMMTTDKKERLEAELEYKVEEARFRAEQNNIAFDADRMWTDNEIDDLLRKLPEAPDINSITNIDKATAKKMFWRVINNKTSEPLFYLFLKPETMLRRNAFFIGYFEHLEMKPWDTKGAIEAGKRKIANTQGLYSAAERQFGWGTRLGKLALKFAQYSYNQWTVYRKLIPEAVAQALEHGWKSLNPVHNLAMNDGEKINVGSDEKPVYVTNVGRRLVSTLLMNSMTMAFTGTGIYGLGSVTNPVLSALVAWLKILISMSGDDDKELRRMKPKDRQKAIEIKRKEFSQNLNDALPWFGFGIKAPVSMAIGHSADNLIKSNRTYTILKATAEQIVPGGKDPDWIYAVSGLYEPKGKEEKKRK